MTEEMFDTMEGLFAYEDGCVDSGIHDAVKKAEIKSFLHSDALNMEIFSRQIGRAYLSDEALGRGYTVEDVASLLKWLDREMEFSL